MIWVRERRLAGACGSPLRGIGSRPTLADDRSARCTQGGRSHITGGWINKFEGDAALAVFGAPIAVDDSAGRALRAARQLSQRLGEKVAELEAGIGVSCGDVVAGNIGAESRYEYTVIGDPVNEAARLTELAKDYEPRVVASAAAIESAEAGERERWELGEEVTLRGRPQATRLARPG